MREKDGTISCVMLKEINTNVLIFCWTWYRKPFHPTGNSRLLQNSKMLTVIIFRFFNTNWKQIRIWFKIHFINNDCYEK